MPQIRYDETTVYCSVDDVRKNFRKEDAFTQNSNPSDQQVLDFIYEASAAIDDYTRYSWRDNQVVEKNKSFDGEYRWSNGRPLVLPRWPVRTPFEQSEGDKIEVYNGSEWEDWVADPSHEEGRQEDYWVEDGHILWIERRFTWVVRPQIRVTYRYGEDVTTTTETLDDGTEYEVIDQPRSINRACSKLVAADLLSSDQFSQLTPGTGEGMSPQQAAQHWEDQVYGTKDRDGTLDRYKVDPAWVEPL